MIDQIHAPRRLDSALLREYEDRLRLASVPVDSWTTPGLNEQQIVETLSPLGLTLPIEARIWWEWHDGCPGRGRRKIIAPRGEGFLSLSEAVETRKRFRQIVEDSLESDIPALADPDRRWKPSWLPITGFQLPLVIDCSVAQGAPTPVKMVDLSDAERLPPERARSMGEMIEIWIRALDCGAWQWNQSQSEWIVDRDRMDEEFRLSPLI